MSTSVLKINGKSVKIDTNKPKVAALLEQLIKALTTREFPIGMALDHSNGGEYLLARIRQSNSTYRAYLINTDTGIARNSDKAVKVLEADGGGEFGRGYVETLPARKDRFYDPDNDGQFIDVD